MKWAHFDGSIRRRCSGHISTRRRVLPYRRSVATSPSTGTVEVCHRRSVSLSKCTYFTVDGYYRRNVPTSPSTGTTVSSKCTHFTVDGYYRRSVPTSPSTGTASKCVTVEVYLLHRRRVLSSKWAHFTVDGYYRIVEVYLLHRRRVLPYRRTVDGYYRRVYPLHRPRVPSKCHRRSVPTSPSKWSPSK